MASYFIKYKVASLVREGDYFEESMIIDFDEFEKVNSDSIHNKIVEKMIYSGRNYKIQDIVKL